MAEMKDYQALKELLEKETYPLAFSFKFIGKNSPVFHEGTKNLQQQFPGLTKRSQRLSQNQNHIACTYAFEAPSADMIIDVFRAISKIPDLSLIL